VQLPNGTATEARSYAAGLANGAGLPAASVASGPTERMACCLRLRPIRNGGVGYYNCPNARLGAGARPPRPPMPWALGRPYVIFYYGIAVLTWGFAVWLGWRGPPFVATLVTLR